MDENIKRPTAALINREWLEAAGGVLDRKTLSEAVLCACEYVLYGEIRQNVGGSLGVVLAMIKPALDSDIAKYTERCARNAANAKSRFERAAASGSESLRVVANTTTTPNTTTNTTTTPTTSLSQTETEERERWLIFGYFWSTGSNAIREEVNAFWSYYESLGWKNNKGAPVVNKLACAHMWNRRFELRPAPNGADAWFKVMQNCEFTDYSLFTAFLGAERTEDGAVVRLRCTEPWMDDFKAKCGHLITALGKLWRIQNITLERA